MDYTDLRLGQQQTFTGEVRTVSMLDGNDEFLPDGEVYVTLRVVLADQVRTDVG